MIASNIESLLAMGQIAGQICVIGPSDRARSEIMSELNKRNIRHVELRRDVDYESDHIKISTIESAKGHEFSVVYIMGLNEGTLPLSNAIDDDIAKEASRFYVAMTRAREILTITYSSNALASRFLAVIQSDCQEAIMRNGELRMLKNGD
jgi:superfamily I DNA/RNA helicase